MIKITERIGKRHSAGYIHPIILLPTLTHPAMSANAPVPVLPAVVATLLVLLPGGVSDGAHRAPAATFAGLPALQSQLGAAVRVLVVTEASHPAVVRSFRATELPSFVLMRQGVELWRQRGLPEGETIGALLLSKLSEGPATRPT